MTAPDLIRLHDREYLPGHPPSLDGPSRNGRDWLTAGRAGGLYAYGKSDPRRWPRGIRQVTARVTPDDITAGRRKGGPHPVAAAVRRALRLPGDAAVAVFGDWFSIRSAATCEHHDLPAEGAEFCAAWTRRGRCAPFTFTFTTCEDWQASGEEES